MHGMSNEASRRAAGDQAAADDGVELDESAQGPGVREWLGGLDPVHGVPAAAFDTRIDGPAVITGRASKAIAKQLEKHGFSLLADPESFLVDRHNHLVDGEADRAAAWGSSSRIRRELSYRRAVRSASGGGRRP